MVESEVIKGLKALVKSDKETTLHIAVAYKNFYVHMKGVLKEDADSRLYSVCSGEYNSITFSPGIVSSVNSTVGTIYLNPVQL